MHPACRIMIVDDNHSDIELLRTALEELGLPTILTVATGGQQALDQLSAMQDAAAQPHLVLLDLNMPAVGGHEVLAFIRRQPALAALRVVILSTSTQPADRQRCLDAGADGYLVKPALYGDFLSLVDQVYATYIGPVAS